MTSKQKMMRLSARPKPKSCLIHIVVIWNVGDYQLVLEDSYPLMLVMLSFSWSRFSPTSSIIDDYQEADDASSDEFHYPQSSTSQTPRPTSRSSGSADCLSRTGSSRVPVDLTPHLTQAPDFRVPTREAPQNILSPRRTPPSQQQLLPQWERDETVQQCRDCRRRFNFLNRRVNLYNSICHYTF